MLPQVPHPAHGAHANPTVVVPVAGPDGGLPTVVVPVAGPDEEVPVAITVLRPVDPEPGTEMGTAPASSS